jgi:hypothetical protein
MGHNTSIDPMTPALHPAFAPDERVPRAIAILHTLDTSEVSQVMVARLACQRDRERGLPPRERDEDPAAIFIDVIRCTSDLEFANKLRFSCVDALRQVSFEAAPSPDVLGSLCYLAAAMRALEALDVLPGMVTRNGSEQMLLRDGEPVRSRALRALIGLLACDPARASQTARSFDLRGLFENLLAEPKYQILALTGLIGLWPNRRQEFINMLPLGQVELRRVNVSLELAGFAVSAALTA